MEPGDGGYSRLVRIERGVERLEKAVASLSDAPLPVCGDSQSCGALNAVVKRNEQITEALAELAGLVHWGSDTFMSRVSLSEFLERHGLTGVKGAGK